MSSIEAILIKYYEGIELNRKNWLCFEVENTVSQRIELIISLSLAVSYPLFMLVRSPHHSLAMFVRFLSKKRWKISIVQILLVHDGVCLFMSTAVVSVHRLWWPHTHCIHSMNCRTGWRRNNNTGIYWLCMVFADLSIGCSCCKIIGGAVSFAANKSVSVMWWACECLCESNRFLIVATQPKGINGKNNHNNRDNAVCYSNVSITHPMEIISLM